MITAVINTHALIKMFYSSALAGVSFVVVFSVGILGAARSSEKRREHRAGPAVAYTALAAAGLLAAAALVIYGITLVAQKT